MAPAAGKLRVLIATTNGPVEVLLLTEEDAAIGRCVACIGGTTETADIAAAYHAFVVRPTGVIEGRFGHSCYRLDVSGRIDAGSSWQLGVLAAHALLANGRLAQENDAADGVLWATGSVRPVDLTVGGVSHVPQKLASSLERLKEERTAGRRVLLALPAANTAEVAPAIAGDLAALGIEMIAPAHVQTLFDALAMKLPDSPQKAPVPATTPAAARPGAVIVARPRWRFAGATAVAMIALLGATSVFLQTRKADPDPAGEKQRTGSPQPVPLPMPIPPAYAPRSLPDTAATRPAVVGPQPAPGPPVKRVDLVPEAVPFITARDKTRLRYEYLPAADYKAVATSLLYMAFVSGQPSQDAADRAAVETCEKRNGAARAEAGLPAIRMCELYASGNAVVSRRARPAMPPTPWVIRNPTVERPFVGGDLPLVGDAARKRAAENYHTFSRSKVYVVGPSGYAGVSTGQASADEAMRLSLERCGYSSGDACMVVAVDDTFVVPIPTLARAVGFYRPAALNSVHPGARDDVARQLANATDGWNAVAAGAGGQAGIKVAAGSEQSAIDGALEECGKRDRDCRIVVIGPFLVERNQGSARPMSNTPSSP
jgi:hypothetical protein